MRHIDPGTYPAKITRVEPFTYRNRSTGQFEPGISIRFVTYPHGQFDEVVTNSTHHKGLLARLLAPIAKARGIGGSGLKALLAGLVGATIAVNVESDRCGPTFQFCEVTELVKNWGGEVEGVSCESSS